MQIISIKISIKNINYSLSLTKKFSLWFRISFLDIQVPIRWMIYLYRSDKAQHWNHIYGLPNVENDKSNDSKKEHSDKNMTTIYSKKHQGLIPNKCVSLSTPSPPYIAKFTWVLMMFSVLRVFLQMYSCNDNLFSKKTNNLSWIFANC